MLPEVSNAICISGRGSQAEVRSAESRGHKIMADILLLQAGDCCTKMA